MTPELPICRPCALEWTTNKGPSGYHHTLLPSGGPMGPMTGTSLRSRGPNHGLSQVCEGAANARPILLILRCHKGQLHITCDSTSSSSPWAFTQELPPSPSEQGHRHPTGHPHQSCAINGRWARPQKPARSPRPLRLLGASDTS
jgi:hypothetical protein